MVQLTLEEAVSDGSVSLTGAEMVERAGRWVVGNWYAWERMKEEAVKRAREGRRFAISDLAEEARYRMRTEGKDQGFKINNSLRAALARRLIRECPEVKPYIEIRASKVDWA